MSNISSIIFPVFGFTMIFSYVAERRLLARILKEHPVSPLPKFVAGIPTRLSGLYLLLRTLPDPKLQRDIRAFRLFHIADVVSLTTCIVSFAYDFTRNVIIGP